MNNYQTQAMPSQLEISKPAHNLKILNPTHAQQVPIDETTTSVDPFLVGLIILEQAVHVYFAPQDVHLHSPQFKQLKVLLQRCTL